MGLGTIIRKLVALAYGRQDAELARLSTACAELQQQLDAVQQLADTNRLDVEKISAQVESNHLAFISGAQEQSTIVSSTRETNDSALQFCLKRLMQLERKVPKECVNASGLEELEVESTESLDVSLEKLKQIAPCAFPEWHALLNVNAEAYTGYPVHSCSVDGHPSAELFSCFVHPYLSGRVLDIGCGPQPVPLYLSEYDTDLVYGIDPISNVEDHPFHFHKGVAEFLPWADNSFNVAVCATSLDHALLPDLVFDEVRRVLIPGGRFLVWEAFVPGSKPYDPTAGDIKPVDQYHLFHFDREFFEKSIDGKFVVDDVIRITVGIEHSFYSLMPQEGKR